MSGPFSAGRYGPWAIVAEPTQTLSPATKGFL